MEIQNAVNPANAGANNPAPGGSGLTGKPGGGAAEMRSAFEAMLGALLGLLHPAPHVSLAQPAAGDAASTTGQPGGEATATALSLESLFAQINGKSTPAGQTPPTGPLAQEVAAQPALSAVPAAPGEGASTPTATGVSLPLPQQMAPAGEAISPPVGAGNPAGAPAGSTGQFSAAQMEALAPDEGGQSADIRPPSPTPGSPFASALGAAQESGSAGKANPTGAAPAPSIPAPPPEQIGEQVRLSLGRGEQEATLQLNPKELGSVRIRLQMENGQLHLSIRAEQAETGRLLDGKLAELRHSLENQGIKVGDLAVARSERTVAGEGLGREVAPASRSGQMDMNANDSSSQRQPAAFAGGGFDGGNPAGRQVPRGQQAGPLDSPAHTGRASADVWPGPAATARPAGVDYYA